MKIPRSTACSPRWPIPRAAPMKSANAWMSRYEKFWSDKLDSLALHRHHPVAPEKVWRAWTDPLAQWWGPGGPAPVAVAALDVRVGGRFRGRSTGLDS